MNGIPAVYADSLPKQALVADLPLIRQVLENPIAAELAQQVVNFARLRAADGRLEDAGKERLSDENYTVIRMNIMDIITGSEWVDELIK